jgi:hypothetical protein
MAYVHKAHTRKEQLQRVLGAARNINSPAVLRKFTSSLVRKVIQADGGHYEQLV